MNRLVASNYLVVLGRSTKQFQGLDGIEVAA
jgi:hypothetical protein